MEVGEAGAGTEGSRGVGCSLAHLVCSLEGLGWSLTEVGSVQTSVWCEVGQEAVGCWAQRGCSSLDGFRHRVGLVYSLFSQSLAT